MALESEIFRSSPVTVQRDSQNTPVGHNLRAQDICYYCQQRGHWAQNCPAKLEKKSGPFDSSGVNGPDFPDKQCPCGGGICAVLTSHTEKNPGKKYYRCPAKSGSGRCPFFQWCDVASLDQTQRCYVAEPAYPICSCGAGRCILLSVKKEGGNVGRKFFACPVKRGQGACNFFQWQELPGRDHEMSNNHLDDCEQLNSSSSIYDPNKDTKATNCKFDGMVSDEFGEKGSPSASSKGCQDKEATRSNSMIDDDRLPPIEGPSLHEHSPVGAVARFGKCYRCGEEGHWMNECVRSPPSQCFKCGKTGHWKKNCPA